MDLQLQRAVRVEHLALEQTLVNGGFWPTAALRTVTFDPAGYGGAAEIS
jgi:hypothetical protein